MRLKLIYNPVFIAIICSYLVACGKSIEHLNVIKEQRMLACEAGVEKDTLELRFVGTSGFFIRHGTDSILTSPFISNNSLFDVLVPPIRSKTEIIDKWMPRFNTSDVKAIVIGHGHYDHLLDVPYIAATYTQDAIIYGSNTSYNLICKDPLMKSAHFQRLDDIAWSPGKPKNWLSVPDSNIRILPIKSLHAPHFGDIRLGHGEFENPNCEEETPSWALKWQDGQVLTYLIEFYSPDDEGKALFRILFTDSSSETPYGIPPTDIGPIDIVIPTVASYHNLVNPMDIIEKTEPAHIVFGHWDNFLQTYNFDMEKLKSVPATDVEHYLSLLNNLGYDETRVSILNRGARLFYKRCETNY